MDLDRCDALIIGGGPAGSTCARTLVDAGLDVRLIDKATFPRDKPCAGWITPPVVRTLRLDLDAYRASGRVCQPITAFRTSRIDARPGRTGGRAIDTDFDAPVSYGICRREFDHYLLDRCGARVRMGTPLTALRRSDHGDGDWIVNETIRTPLVIGAGGHFCPVARYLMAGATGAGAAADARADAARTAATAAMAGDARAADVRDQEDIVAAQEIEVRMTPAQAAACVASGDRPELYLCEDLKGYGWCFRKEDVLNIGLGRLDRHGLSAHVKAFADWLVADGRVPRDLAWRWKGHAYLLREASQRPLVADGVMLIGDAAGLAYGRSGEGIRPAVESAVLAAQTIVAARASFTRASFTSAASTHASSTHASYRRAVLDPYRAAIESRFGAGTGAVASAAGGVVSERLGIALGAALLRTRRFTRDVLLRRWFLRMQDSPLEDGVPLMALTHDRAAS
jgi:flavin-dependent dehydrogenase